MDKKHTKTHIKTLKLNRIIRYTHPTPSLEKLLSAGDVLTHALTRLMTVIILIKNWQSRRGKRGFVTVCICSRDGKILHSCCCVCYQGSVTLDVQSFNTCTTFSSIFSCKFLKLSSGLPATWPAFSSSFFTIFSNFPISNFEMFPPQETEPKHNKKATYITAL